MKTSLLFILLALTMLVTAQNYTDYKSNIAKDRILLQFNSNVSATRIAEIIKAAPIVTASYAIPNPASTVCMVSDLQAAKTYFLSVSEVKHISFYITDGKNYAAVLPSFFVKLTDKNFESALNDKLKKLNLPTATPDLYISNLYSIQNYSAVFSNTIELCADFAKQGWCQYASPNYLLNPLVCSNDPFYNRQWSIANTGTALQGNGTADADMDVDTAWSITAGSATIKVGIIDSGVDTLQPDLVANILPGHDALGDTTDGYPTPLYDEDGHGTCCAGIVAAVRDNNIGISGVAPLCKIIPVRSFYYVETSPGGSTLPLSTAAAFADAIGWAWSVADADILSNSWGLPPALISLLPGGLQPVNDAINTAHTMGRGGKGLALFFSSGNENGSAGPIWPGSLPNTISVNASTMCDERKSPSDCSTESWGGDYGPGLDFAAPGVRIATTDMRGAFGFTSGDIYGTFNGTSAACPNAAAVGALVLSLRPDLAAEDVRAILAKTCDKVGGYAYDSTFANGTWAPQMGHGRINALSALQLAQTYLSTSIIETKNTLAFTISPNPTSGLFSIQLNHEQASVKVYSITGVAVQTNTLVQGNNTIDISALPTGIYFVQLQVANQLTTRKVILAK